MCGPAPGELSLLLPLPLPPAVLLPARSAAAPAAPAAVAKREVTAGRPPACKPPLPVRLPAAGCLTGGTGALCVRPMRGSPTVEGAAAERAPAPAVLCAGPSALGCGRRWQHDGEQSIVTCASRQRCHGSSMGKAPHMMVSTWQPQAPKATEFSL